MEAQLKRQQNGLQSSYNLPFHALRTDVYPLLSANGASIVLYGHEKGLSLFKVYRHNAKAETKTGDEAYKSVAADDDKRESFHTDVGFEKWLDVELDSPVQRVAFPPLSVQLANEGRIPNVLTSTLIVAACCTDLSIRFISIPLTALSNSHETKDESQVRVTHISSAGTHQDLISAISLTWTADDQHQDDNKVSQPLYASHGISPTAIERSFSFLVASCSTTGNGLVVVHRLRFEDHLVGKVDSHTTIVRQSMRLPLFGGALAFNSSVHPSPNHLSLLLTSPAHGIGKTLDLTKSILLSKKRRGSDTSTNTEGAVVTPVIASSTFSTSYIYSSQPPRRKAILDAQWVSSGRSVLILLEDGEWGLWDVSPSKWNSKPDNAASRFTVLGQLTAISPVKKSSKSKTLDPLAPMTPHTRKLRTANLFGQNVRTNVSEVPTAKAGRVILCSSVRLKSSADNAIILTYDGTHHYLPSLQSFTQSTFTEDRGGRKGTAGLLHTLPGVCLGGEHHLSTQVLAGTYQRKIGTLATTLSATPELLIFTDTRLIALTRSDPETVIATTQTLVLRNIPPQRTFIMESHSMGGGMLDVEGIDKVLENMEGDQGSIEEIQGPQSASPFSKVPDGPNSAETPSKRATVRPKKLIIHRDGTDAPSNLCA